MLAPSNILLIVLLVGYQLNNGYCGKIVDKCVASTNQHNYIGFSAKTYDNEDVYCSYLGIKYATSERFKEGVEYVSDMKDVKAVEDGPECIQLKGNITSGDEDCLFLSVHSPTQSNGLLPVLVYIHGGGFAIGTSKLSYQKPDFFMKTKKVVMVIIQYRLGALGFVDFNSDEFPSNLGLKDQVLALKWVKENIGAFGGDKDKVTIQGQSAGAASVSLHLFSPLSKGLFRAGISESGSGCASWSVLPKVWARERLKYLAAVVGCPVSDIPANILDPADLTAQCLIKKPAKKLILATEKFTMMKGMNAFLPVVEKESYKNTFLTYFPWSGPVNQVPWISGVNSNEAGSLIYVLGSKSDKKDSKLNISLPKVLYYEHTTLNPDDVTKEIEQHYQFSVPIDMMHVQGAAKAVNDGMFGYPNYLCHKIHSGSPSYNYYFNYVASALRRRLVRGVFHTEELQFLFIRNGENIRINGDSLDKEISNKLVDLWVKFAETSNPSVDEIKWDPYKESANQVLIINESGFNMAQDPDLNDNKFWEILSFRPLMP